MLDGMYRLAVPDVFGFWYLPLTLIISGMERKGHQKTVMVVQYKSLEVMWNKQYVQELKNSLICSVLYSTICCVMSGLTAWEVSNWHLENSIFYQETGQCYGGTVFAVFLLYFFTNFIRTLGVQTLMLYGEMHDRRKMIFVIFLSGIVVLEWMFPNLSLYFNLFSISWQNFANSSQKYVLMAAGPALMWVMYSAGKVQWKKREFYE